MDKSGFRRVSRATGRFWAAFIACAVLGLAPAAAAQVLRFTTTATGGIAVTGNSLGLSKASSLNGPGTKDSIGTFISLDASSADLLPAVVSGPWLKGTTADWTKNGSQAVLDLPPDAKVLYAELIWGGSSNYGGENVTALLDTPVTLSRGNTSIAVTPAPATSLNIATTAHQSSVAFAANYYLRTADVTAFVKKLGAGSYAVSGVPATQNENINSLNAAGWTLVVSFWSALEPPRTLSLFVSGSFVDENSVQDYSFSGLCTPPSGQVSARLVIGAVEGDANLVGDQLGIAATAADTFQALSGPNNPVNNFFASQINGNDGTLDTRGSFGTVNHDAASGVNASGARQSWDITSLGVSSADGQLDIAQQAVVVRASTTGDAYLPAFAGFAADTNAPRFLGGSSASVAPSSVEQDGAFKVTLKLKNSGLVAATLKLEMPLGSALALVDYQTDGVSGDAAVAPVDAAMLTTGVNAGTLAPGATRTVEVTLRASAAPASGDTFQLLPHWLYSYKPCAGNAAIHDDWPLPQQQVTFGATAVSGGGGAGGQSTGAAGDGTSGSQNVGGASAVNEAGAPAATPGSDAGAPATTPGNDAGGEPDGSANGGASNAAGASQKGDSTAAAGSDDGGCSCGVVGSPSSSGALLGLMLLVAARRSRRATGQS